MQLESDDNLIHQNLGIILHYAMANHLSIILL